MKKIIFIFCGLCFFSISIFNSQAQALQPTGAVAAATAETGVGSLEDVDGVYLNPASIAFFSKKSFAVSYSNQHLNAQITDNGAEAFFPAALMYMSSDRGGLQTKSLHLAVAYQVFKNLALGIDGAYRELRPTSQDQKFRQTILSAGIFYHVHKSVQLGFVSKNKPLNDTDLADSIDQGSTLAFGASYIYDDFAKFKFDVESNENQKIDRLIYKFGLETYINDWIVTRIGYQNDNVYSLNYLTAGMGFAGPQFGLHYAYQAEANKKTDPLHTVDLNIPF